MMRKGELAIAGTGRFAKQDMWIGGSRFPDQPILLHWEAVSRWQRQNEVIAVKGFQGMAAKWRKILARAYERA
jgi:hypothetical protein